MKSRVLIPATAAVVVVAAVCYAVSANSRDAGRPAVNTTSGVTPATRASIPPLAPPAAPAPPAAAPQQAPVETVPHPTLPGTRIEPGTPPQFLSPYLVGQVPTLIKKDGTQIYRGLPGRAQVRQPDGTFKAQDIDVEIKPATPLPTPDLEKEAAGG